MKVVKFETRYTPEPVDWVELAPTGASFTATRTWLRVKDVTPPDHLKDVSDGEIEKLSDFEARLVLRWRIIGPAYAAYKRSEDLPEDGTPLAAWPGVSAEQAKILRDMGIRTVEDVVTMGEQATSALKWPNARRLPEMAKAYLDGQGVAEKDAELAAMRERMAAMEELLEAKMTKDGKVDGRTKAGKAAKADEAA